MKQSLLSGIDRVKLIVAQIILLLFTSLVYASEKPIWIEAVGVAPQGLHDTLDDVKKNAKRDAESKAVEQAVGAFVKAHTLVSNYQIAEDLIYTAVRGKIDRSEILKEGWDEKDRNLYKVHLKALVEPVYPEKGEGLSIKLSLSKTDLKEGDEVKIFYEANSDCFIYIFSVAADGSVTLLMPNSKNKDNSIKAKKAYSFPPEGSEIRLQAQFLPEYEKETAEERIKIVATKQKEELLSLSFQEGFFKVYDAKSTGMISDLQKSLSKITPTDWTEATAVYILKRGGKQ